MASTHEAQMPFIRNLASSDRKLRTASLDSLKTFLASRKQLQEQDALKLWKGLYFAHWMTDRPAPQQRLAADLALLADSLPRQEHTLPVWYAAFWNVLGQQWLQIDKLRLDKFLLLIRRVFAAQLRHAREGNEGVLAGLKEWPFEEEGDLRKVPLGLRLHVLDIWVDELERQGCLGEEPDAEFAGKIGKMVEALRYSHVKQVRERARESYEDERLPWGTKAEGDEEMGDDDNDDDDDGWGGIAD